MMDEEKLDYGNWVPKWVIYGSGLVGLIFSVSTAWLIYMAIPAVLFLSAATYLAYVRFRFSPSGGNIQNSVCELVISNLDWDGNGEALDIGCGNGVLAIMLAKKYPDAKVIGIDLWGKTWEYSKDVCESNARIERVSPQIL
jgi:methylase of polypeptide subunit release factors